MNNEETQKQNHGRLADLLVRIVLVAVLAAFLCLVYSRAGAEDVAVSGIDEQLRASTEVTALQECSARELLQFLDIDAGSYDSFVYYKSGEALGVEELLVLKARDKEDLSPARDAVQTRIDDQIQAFEGYGPEQVKMLKNAVVILRGNFLFYCVAPDTAPYEEVFRNAV
ncbi:MAG: DUF4358 domain-containing protein [Mogibacterium sp.]|nr:DUF4358 domain-containing protein [Mogibacterium sp.]